MECIREIAGAPKPVGPYSAAVKAGGMIFVSGQIGLHPETGQIVDGGIAAQTAQVLENLRAVLEGCGSSPERMVMTSIFLSDITFGPLVNDLYGRFVDPKSPPARQTVAVKALPMGALIEISVIAVSE